MVWKTLAAVKTRKHQIPHETGMPENMYNHAVIMNIGIFSRSLRWALQ